jgi:hypothetical protein
MEQQYWASKPAREIAKEIKTRFDDYKQFIETSGILADLRKSYSTYYSRPYIQNVDQSLKAIHVNLYRNTIKTIKTIVTATRPAWEPKAVNTDVESQADTQLAAGLLDYYMREKQIENKVNKSTERSLYLKEGWVSVGWSPTSGNVYGQDPETGAPIHEGDIKCATHTILDVARDFRRRDMNHKWYIIREFENRHDLVARLPELKDKLLNVEADDRADIKYELAIASSLIATKGKATDLIATYTLFHEKTEAMPQGRMTVMTGDDIVIFDGPLPYKRIYLFPIVSSEQEETGFGNSELMDLLPIQDAFDANMSAILSNQAAFGVQNVQSPKGASPSVTKIEGGMNLVEYDPKAGKLEPLNLLQTAPEIFTFAETLQKLNDLIGGTPPITKGIAPADMSGTAMALLQQQAIQFSSGVDNSRTALLENVGTAIVELLQTYAVVPRVALIAGKSKRSMMREFSNKDLKGISRVIVDTANPLTKTASGRIAIADNLLNRPDMIKTPEQYIGVLTTGNLEPLYQHDNANRMLMASENERLMEGADVPVVLTDDDVTHILEHQCVMASPEARENPKIMTATLAHIQAHINNGKTKDPALALALKQVSMYQPPMPPMPPPGGPGQASPNGPIKTAQIVSAQNPVTQQAQQVPLPEPAQPPQINQP